MWLEVLTFPDERAPLVDFSAKMAEVMYGLVSEAKRNRFSAIPKLTEEGNVCFAFSCLLRLCGNYYCCLLAFPFFAQSYLLTHRIVIAEIFHSVFQIL